jgi:hypothetical protein
MRVVGRSFGFSDAKEPGRRPVCPVSDRLLIAATGLSGRPGLLRPVLCDRQHQRIENPGSSADQHVGAGDASRKLALIGGSSVGAKQVADAEAVHACPATVG